MCSNHTALLCAYAILYMLLVHCRNITLGITHAATDNRLSLGHTHPQSSYELMFQVHKFMIAEQNLELERTGAMKGGPYV